MLKYLAIFLGFCCSCFSQTQAKPWQIWGAFEASPRFELGGHFWHLGAWSFGSYAVWQESSSWGLVSTWQLPLTSDSVQSFYQLQLPVGDLLQAEGSNCQISGNLGQVLGFYLPLISKWSFQIQLGHHIQKTESCVQLSQPKLSLGLNVII